jgi:hypothetical protein
MTKGRLNRVLARVLIGEIALVALFVACEVGMRHLPPDGLTFTEVKITQGVDAHGQELPARRTLDYTITYDSRRQATINTWYTALNDGQDIGGPFLHCNGEPPVGPYYDHTFTFTWHGISVESATDEASACPAWLLSSGGIPDYWHFRWLWTNPMQAPNAPPLPSPPLIR